MQTCNPVEMVFRTEWLGGAIRLLKVWKILSQQRFRSLISCPGKWVRRRSSLSVARWSFQLRSLVQTCRKICRKSAMWNFTGKAQVDPFWYNRNSAHFCRDSKRSTRRAETFSLHNPFFCRQIRASPNLPCLLAAAAYAQELDWATGARFYVNFG